MNDPKIAAAFRTVARYQAASEQAPAYYVVGRGPYHLVAVFDDGVRQLKAQGFDSIEDAELFAEYASATSPGALEALKTQLTAQGVTVPTPPRQFVRFEICTFVVAVPSETLGKLPRLE